MQNNVYSKETEYGGKGRHRRKLDGTHKVKATRAKLWREKKVFKNEKETTKKKLGDAWEIEWMRTVFRFYHDGEPIQWSWLDRPKRYFENSKHASRQAAVYSSFLEGFAILIPWYFRKIAKLLQQPCHASTKLNVFTRHWHRFGTRDFSAQCQSYATCTCTMHIHTLTFLPLKVFLFGCCKRASCIGPNMPQLHTRCACALHSICKFQNFQFEIDRSVAWWIDARFSY